MLGASNYTYAEARWSEALADWIGAHVNAFAPSAACRARWCATTSRPVSRRCRYEPGSTAPTRTSPTHYDTAILPTRPRKPRDKAKVEVGVLIVERYVLARLRKTRSSRLAELNAAIREIVADLNTG